MNVPSLVFFIRTQKYLSNRANIFDSTRAAVDVRSGSPVASSDTVYFSVVDDEGNACSFIVSFKGRGAGRHVRCIHVHLQTQLRNYMLSSPCGRVLAYVARWLRARAPAFSF